MIHLGNKLSLSQTHKGLRQEHKLLFSQIQKKLGLNDKGGGGREWIWVFIYIINQLGGRGGEMNGGKGVFLYITNQPDNK